METLTTQSLTACNIYVRAAHRAQRRTILGNSPWMTRSANKQKHTWLCLCTEDIAGHEWPAMADTHKTNVQKKKKKKAKRSTATESMCSLFQHPSKHREDDTARAMTNPCGPEALPSSAPAMKRAQKQHLHTPDCTHCCRVTVREDQTHFAATLASAEKEVANETQLRSTCSIHLTRCW